MTPKKLSETDKQNILHLYRHPGETTTTLAERYGVSNTTISRVLKSLLPEQEYEALVQQKRAARPQAGFAEFAAELAFEDESVDESEEAIAVPEVAQPVSTVTAVAALVEAVVEVEDQPAEVGTSETAVETVAVEAEPIEAVAPPVTKPAIAPPIKRRQRKRSSGDEEAEAAELEAPEVMEAQLQLLDIPVAVPEVEKKQPKAPPIVKAATTPSEAADDEIAREILSENLQDRAADLMDLEDEDDDLDDDDLDDDDLDDLDDEDEDDDDEGDLDDGSFMAPQLQAK